MSLHDYAAMLFESPRIDLFQRALEDRVEPGMRVLEIGTGLGTYALFAARAGAEVTALERGEVIHHARTLAERNGLAPRIRFLQGQAPDDLPEGPWDLVVFEDYPSTLLDRDTHRLLAALGREGGVTAAELMPRAARLAMAPVVGNAWQVTGLLPQAGGTAWGLRWDELRERLGNSIRKVHLPTEALAAPPVWSPRFELLPPPPVDALGLGSDWEAGADPVVGLALWFELELDEGRTMSNAPGAPGEPWGQCLLPLDPPLEAPSDTQVRARIWREPGPDGGPGWLAWSCRAGDQERRGHEFAGIPLSLEALGLEGAHPGQPGEAVGPDDRRTEGAPE